MQKAGNKTVGAQFRPDIQGLRAIAVLLVVIFHIFPEQLGGGYVGVDVFFVISGYLITGILLRQATGQGRVGLLRFYERRARRLLPAASVTLVAAGLAAFFILPPLRWEETGWEIIAASFYVENFFLYFRSFDYLAADYAPTVFQHYWSLSIEEQFYLFWPLLIGGIAFAFRNNARRLKAGLTITFVAVFTLSLAASVALTPVDSGTYFLTPARIWELALGGLVALLSPRRALPAPLVAGLRWMGLAFIFTAAILFDQQTAFPGYAALLPTIGTALLLGIVDSGRAFDPNWALANAPMRYIGDISYSYYLWHWPVIIFAGVMVGDSFNLVEGMTIAVIGLLLAHFSKFYIEDRFRERPDGTGMARSYLVGGGFILVSVIVALSLLVPAQLAQRQAEELTFDFGEYPGALAIYDGDLVYPERPFIPALEFARRDNASVYEDGCHRQRHQIEPQPCIYGVEGAATTIAVVGDSHAAQWVPALQLIADQRGYELITHTKSACPFILEANLHGSEPYPECRVWNEAVIADLIDRQPDLVLTSKFSSTWVEGYADVTENNQRVIAGLAMAWGSLSDAGIAVLAIEHTPRFQAGDIPGCVAANLGNPDACAIDLEEATTWYDPMPEAAAQVLLASTINMNSAICEDQVCRPIIGNVLAYRDAHHLTATFARTLSAALASEIVPRLENDVIVSGSTAGAAADAVVSPDIAFQPVSFDFGAYPGALVRFDTSAASIGAAPVRPQPDRARNDFPDLYRDGCHRNRTSSDALACQYGPVDTGRVVALVGDSHAAHYAPALRLLADEIGFTLHTFTKSNCPLMAATTLDRGVPYTSCDDWNGAVTQALLQLSPDLVVTSRPSRIRIAEMPNQSGADRAIEAGLVASWQLLGEAGINVLAVEQTPVMPFNVPECLIENEDWAVCGRPRQEALMRFDPTSRAVAAVPSADMIRVNDLVCDADWCPATIGNTLIYRDNQHFTTTFARTLAPVLAPRIREGLGQ